MRITKSQLRKIIKEELQQEGFMDTVAGKLGYEKKQNFHERSDRIKAVRKMFLNIGRDEDELDKAMDALHALGVADEVGEEGSVELALWNASSGVYEALNKLNATLEDAYNEVMSVEEDAVWQSRGAAQKAKGAI